ncbi:MAG TPA: hypothetical protein VHV55_03260 [Pirellulales bacterium]|jgi:hypothetical protein|nr:hypothetical protein [Pirellulales bacterium]
MRIIELNQPVFNLDGAHPAKMFLLAFVECLEDCPLRELGLDGTGPIDQSWCSTTDGKLWKFSSFVYSFLCFDILLDGFLENAPHLTASELGAAAEIPRLRALMHECAAAAERDRNEEILTLTDQVLRMLSLWDSYLEFREEMASRADTNG